MFQLPDYDYDLPASKIAQTPCNKRSESKLLHLNRKKQSLSHHQFTDLVSLLKDDDLLVINNTRVVPARLLGKKETGGKIEILIIDYAAGMRSLAKKGFFQCECLIKASKRPKKGSILLLDGKSETQVKARVENVKGRFPQPA